MSCGFGGFGGFGGCAPCGGASSYNAGGAAGFNNGYCADDAAASYGASSNQLACNTSETFYQKTSNLCASNAACAGGASRRGCSGYNNGYNGFGSNGTSFNGCGPFVGGCGAPCGLRGFRRGY